MNTTYVFLSDSGEFMNGLLIDNFSLKDISSESRETSLSLDTQGIEGNEVNQGKLSCFFSTKEELTLFCFF